MKKIAYVGIDYHLHSLCIAVTVKGKKEPLDMVRLKNDDKMIRKYMSKLSEKFEINACYEASSNGYCFQRKMAAWGYPCDVIAPSLIPRKPGDHRKNDFRDARDLAQHYAHGTFGTEPGSYHGLFLFGVGLATSDRGSFNYRHHVTTF